jgi:hypothetical protein
MPLFFRKTREEVASLKSELAELKKALEEKKEAPGLANQLVESMGGILASQAQQQPQVLATMSDFLGKTLDMVRRDTARQMGSQGGKKSAAGRAKRKADTQALERLREMAANLGLLLGHSKLTGVHHLPIFSLIADYGTGIKHLRNGIVVAVLSTIRWCLDNLSLTLNVIHASDVALVHNVGAIGVFPHAPLDTFTGRFGRI